MTEIFRGLSKPKSNRKRDATYLFKYLIMVNFIEYLEAGAVPALLLHLAKAFNMKSGQIGLLGGIVYISLSVSSPFAGYLLRHYDHKTVIGLSVTINNVFTLMWALCPVGYSWSTNAFIIIRFFMGATQVVTCLYMPLWTNEFAPKESKTTWMSYQQASVPFGVMMGYIIASLITNISHNADTCFYLLCWRWPFLIEVVLLIPFCVGIFCVPKQHINIKLSHEGSNDKMIEDGINTPEKSFTSENLIKDHYQEVNSNANLSLKLPYSIEDSKLPNTSSDFRYNTSIESFTTAQSSHSTVSVDNVAAAVSATDNERYYDINQSPGDVSDQRDTSDSMHFSSPNSSSKVRFQTPLPPNKPEANASSPIQPQYIEIKAVLSSSKKSHSSNSQGNSLKVSSKGNSSSQVYDSVVYKSIGDATPQQDITNSSGSYDETRSQFSEEDESDIHSEDDRNRSRPNKSNSSSTGYGSASRYGTNNNSAKNSTINGYGYRNYNPFIAEERNRQRQLRRHSMTASMVDPFYTTSVFRPSYDDLGNLDSSEELINMLPRFGWEHKPNSSPKSLFTSSKKASVSNTSNKVDQNYLHANNMSRNVETNDASVVFSPLSTVNQPAFHQVQMFSLEPNQTIDNQDANVDVNTIVASRSESSVASVSANTSSSITLDGSHISSTINGSSKKSNWLFHNPVTIAVGSISSVIVSLATSVSLKSPRDSSKTGSGSASPRQEDALSNLNRNMLSLEKVKINANGEHIEYMSEYELNSESFISRSRQLSIYSQNSSNDLSNRNAYEISAGMPTYSMTSNIAHYSPHKYSDTISDQLVNTNVNASRIDSNSDILNRDRSCSNVSLDALSTLPLLPVAMYKNHGYTRLLRTASDNSTIPDRSQLLQQASYNSQSSLSNLMTDSPTSSTSNFGQLNSQVNNYQTQGVNPDIKKKKRRKSNRSAAMPTYTSLRDIAKQSQILDTSLLSTLRRRLSGQAMKTALTPKSPQYVGSSDCLNRNDSLMSDEGHIYATNHAGLNSTGLLPVTSEISGNIATNSMQSAALGSGYYQSGLTQEQLIKLGASRNSYVSYVAGYNGPIISPISALNANEDRYIVGHSVYDIENGMRQNNDDEEEDPDEYEGRMRSYSTSSSEEDSEDEFFDSPTASPHKRRNDSCDSGEFKGMSDPSSSDPSQVTIRSKSSIWTSVIRLFKMPIYSSLLGAMTSLYFVVTGVQYWGTTYLSVALQAPLPLVNCLFILCAATGPTLGVFFGGHIIDVLGGYKGVRQRVVALELCCLFGVLACLCAIPVTLLESIYLSTLFLWCVLFGGAAVLPACSGMLVSIVPRRHRPLSSSITLVICNMFGYSASLVVSGYVMQVLESLTDGYGNQMCSQACSLTWGFRVVLLFSYISLGFLINALFDAYAVQEKHEAVALRRSSIYTYVVSDQELNRKYNVYTSI